MARRSKEIGSAISFNGEVAQTSLNLFGLHLLYGVGAVLIGHRCVVFGGYARLVQNICIYDTERRTWQSRQVRNGGRLQGRVRMAFVVDDVLYVYIWSSDKQKCRFVTLDLLLMKEWALGGTGACEQMAFGTAGSYMESRNEGVLFGGQSNSTDVLVYSVENRTWYRPKTRGSPPSARFNHTTCSQGEQMFVLGGRSVETEHAFKSLELHVLTMRRQRFIWSTPKVTGYVPRGRFLFAAACISGRIFVFGGYNGYASFDIYSLRLNRWQTGSYKDDFDHNQGFRFMSDWNRGTSDHVLVLTPQRLIVFGGFQLPISTPLHITPL